MASRILKILEERINIPLSDKDLSRHKKLWQITDQLVTTNYDKAFEHVSSEKVEKIVYKDSFRVSRLSDIERYLFKIHGCIDRPEECVLFSEQYEKLYNGKSGATLELFKILSDKIIIFIGFSLNDPFVVELLQLRKDAYDGLKQKNFIITTDNKDFDLLEVEKIQQVNNYTNELDNFLDELVAIRQKYPYGLGMLIKGLEKENHQFNEEEIRKKYFELLLPMENNPETATIAAELKAGEFQTAEERLLRELENELETIEEKKSKGSAKIIRTGNVAPCAT